MARKQKDGSELARQRWSACEIRGGLNHFTGGKTWDMLIEPLLVVR